MQGSALLGGGHPGADFLGEASKCVAGVFETGIDAARSGVGLFDLGALSECGRNVRGCGFDWSAVGAFKRTTSPGLAERSTFVGTPVWKSDMVVSVRQALGCAVVREKSCVVVPPSATARDEALAGA